MPHTHRWEDLLPEEFYEEFERAPIAYWACGAMEDHGLHNALGTDPYTGYEICLRAVRISGGIVFPVVPFAPAYFPGLSREDLRRKDRPLFPPSLWVSGELCERIYVELMESLADMGFKSCIAVGGHAPADRLLQDIEKKLGGRIGKMRFWGGGTMRAIGDVVAEEAKKDPKIGGHGMMWETSLVMAVRRDWVQVERAPRIKTSPLPSQLKPGAPDIIAHIARANPDLGNRLLDIAAERTAKIAREMLVG
jgi:creatinine amidohydrolase/Fe(II)-dependent formamide hydrolase-like protein